LSPRKASPFPLTRERIVTAALGMVDREGLERLSIRRLAAELGSSPMSLYHYVRDKSALYDLILEAVLQEIDIAEERPSAPPGERIIQIAQALRRALLAHPHAVPIALSRSLRTPGQLRPVEAVLGILLGQGMPPGHAMATVNIIGQYVFGTTAAYVNHLTKGRFHEELHEEDIRVMNSGAFPNLAHVLTQGQPLGFQGDFDLGLQVLVEGLLTRRT